MGEEAAAAAATATEGEGGNEFEVSGDLLLRNRAFLDAAAAFVKEEGGGGGDSSDVSCLLNTKG